MKIRQIIPSMFTLVAMLAGFISIIMVLRGMHEPDIAIASNKYYYTAALLIMVSMILDGLDGNVARWLKGCSDFGAELDTYVDLTAFGIAPAILIYAVALQDKNSIWSIILPSAVAVSGVVRLARFKVKDPLRGQGGYAGLPITANAGWVAMFVIASRNSDSPLTGTLMASVFLFGVLTFIILQVTNFRYPKPTKNIPIFVICIILVLLLFARDPRIVKASAWICISLGTLYAFIGPLFVKGVEAHKHRIENKLSASSDVE